MEHIEKKSRNNIFLMDNSVNMAPWDCAHSD